jgi:hypothetical protein
MSSEKVKMKKLFSAALLTFSISLISSRAKEWCGITPLKSTRTDVERILGTPSRERLPAYYLPDEIVYIEYAANPGCRMRLPTQNWNVPEDTVTGITRLLKKRMPLKSLQIDLAKFKKLKSDADVEGHFYYTNEDEGFTVIFESMPDSKEEFVTGYIYAPKAEDKALKCPNLRTGPGLRFL